MNRFQGSPASRFLRCFGVAFRQIFVNPEYLYFLLIGVFLEMLWAKTYSPRAFEYWSLYNLFIGTIGIASVVIPVDKAFLTLSLDFNRGHGQPLWLVQGKYPAAQEIIRIRDAGYGASDYERHKEQIAARLAQPIKNIRKPSPNLKIIEVELKRASIPNLLRYDSLPFDQLQQGEFFVGQGDDGLEKFSLTKMVHMLVAGQTGSGKTQYLRQFLTTLLTRTRWVHVCLIDMKGAIDFQSFLDLPNVEIADRYETAEDLFAQVKDLYEKRKAHLLSKKKIHWNELSLKELEKEKAFEGKPIGPVIIMVDELAELTRRANAAASKAALQEQLMSFASLARFTGIHLVLGTQRPDKSVISMQAKDNLPAKICFSVPSVAASTIVVGNMIASTLGNHSGRAVFVGTRETILQTPLATNAEIDALLVPLSQKLKQTNYNRSVFSGASSNGTPPTKPEEIQ